MDEQEKADLAYVEAFFKKVENRKTNQIAAWHELMGYVGAAVEDGTTIDPNNLLNYMTEIRRDMSLDPDEFNRKRYGIIPENEPTCFCGQPDNRNKVHRSNACEPWTWDGTFTPEQEAFHEQVEVNTQALLDALERTESPSD